MPLIHEEIPIAQQNQEDIYGKKIKVLNKPEQNIGIDTKDTFLKNIVNAFDQSLINISTINNFTNVSRSRDTVYSAIDSMCQDSTIAAVVETYAEDATEYNDDGKIVWAESDDPSINKYINLLLTNLRVDKNSYVWINNLIKYGDIYWQLYKESEYNIDDLLFNQNKSLNEDVVVNAYKKNDHFVQYVEAVANPAEMFELTKFGKSMGYIRTNIKTIKAQETSIMGSTIYNYSFNRNSNDIDLYPATKFVHATLDDDSNRTEEEVDIFLNDDPLDKSKGKNYNYKVRKGQSLLYNIFKIWRELSLLENSILLNRVTKSSILRIIGVEIGDMPKEDVQAHLQGLKAMIEQKAALNTGESFNEYTNAGPVENNIYVPIRNGMGNITTSQIGGDVDVHSLPDVEYFQNKLFGALRIPKQYFGLTGDSAGFDAGKSLSIISSRYAKMIKRIQKAYLQGLTDLVNIFLIDKGLENYINKYTLHMLPPTTQEEIDRRENTSNKIGIINDIMNLIADLPDASAKLKILNNLISTVVNDSNINDIIKEQIEKLEEEESEGEDTSDEFEPEGGSEEESAGVSSDGFNLDSGLGLGEEETTENNEIPGTPIESEESLPTPAELGSNMDFTDNTAEF